MLLRLLLSFDLKTDYISVMLAHKWQSCQSRKRHNSVTELPSENFFFR